jgi:hypothetical protein
MISEEAFKALDDEFQKAKTDYYEAKRTRDAADRGVRYLQGRFEGLMVARDTLWKFRAGK